MIFSHTPIMLNEVIEGLNIQQDGTYVDCTIGGAGHSKHIVSRLRNGTLVGLDQDMQAIAASELALRKLPDKSQTIHLVESNFSRFNDVLDKLSICKVDGVMMDLGVSSHQLDTAERGFSYMKDAPLDARMDTKNPKTAATVVNTYEKQQLTKVIKDYGEERWAARISEFIIEERKRKPIETTFELVEIIKKAVPKNARDKNLHPAKRTFQAIRIEVNDELGVLERSLDGMIDRLNENGRICVISFHSLEDRIVKQKLTELSNPCKCPKEIPYCICNKKATIKILTRKPICPSESEIENNPRARSAKLRIAMRI
jgi:16S rRNA (cytosine1402-N4)-methyltransferase